MSVLVTGGSGYIGGHVVRLLQQAGTETVAVDEVDPGERLAGAPFLSLDLAEPEATVRLGEFMRRHEVAAVVHLAARKQVGESVERPVHYWRQNLGGLFAVLDAMSETGVDRLVFSSSAAVYGAVDAAAVDETAPTLPVNPYGSTKLAGEQLVREAARAQGLRAVSLRYFNVAGAGWPDLGDPTAQNLVTIVLDRLARGEAPIVFGDDYATPDGSGIRDYVHVADLASAHLAALDYLDRDERTVEVFNIGTGSGTSVFEMLDALGRAAGRPIVPEIAARRPGDPDRVVADATLAARVLGWRATRTLEDIAASAWEASRA